MGFLHACLSARTLRGHAGFAGPRRGGGRDEHAGGLGLECVVQAFIKMPLGSQGWVPEFQSWKLSRWLVGAVSVGADGWTQERLAVAEAELLDIVADR